MATAFTIDGQIKVDIDKVINSKCEWYKYTHEEDDTSTVLELISALIIMGIVALIAVPMIKDTIYIKNH